MVLVCACGGGDDSGIDTQANTAAASTAVTQLGTLSSSFGSGDGAGAATAAYSFGGAASTLVQPATQQPQSILPDLHAVTGTCECTENSCTFTNCGDEAGIWTINGTISRSGDDYSFDLEMDINQAGFAWSWATAGDITISDTLIDGSMSGDGDGTFDDQQGGTVEVAWSWDVDADNIQLDGTGCAVGGTMDASVTYEAGNSQGGGSFSGSGSVEFGPTCGQVTAL